MRLWGLTPDGPAFETPFGSRLAPVRYGDTRAMLKVAGGPEERDGAAVMAWWGGDGAAPVLAHEGEALLLVRANDDGGLANLVRRGLDDQATTILCEVAERLHAPRPKPPPSTVRHLDAWFRALWPAASREGGILAQAAETARGLLADPPDALVLHGDLHHGNVLDFGAAGWLAIDPKGLIGERGYDFANLFCNPWPEADDKDRLERRLGLVSSAATLDPLRLRQWILAYAGLSAAWTLDSAMPADGPWRALRIAEMAAAGL
jgi:streptomycin 6-kinase